MANPSLQQQQKEIQLDLSTDEDDLYDAARDRVPNADPSPIKLLHVSFNQDYSRFASGTNRGFRCYTCDPFREFYRQDFVGGVGAVEMLSQFNTLALVGGGEAPKFPSNKVMIWNDHWKRRNRGLPFKSEVCGVRLRSDRLVVVLEKNILVYNNVDYKKLHEIDTIANPKGLCAVSQVGSFVMVCPGFTQGQVRVEHFSSEKTKYIEAHESTIASITLSHEGNLVATASSKGTLVRIHNTHNGKLLHELRRGVDRAEIYCLAFSPTAEWLAVSSDKGTVHVFGPICTPSGNVGEGSSNSPEPNPSVGTSSFSKSLIKGVLPKYFSSEWSLAQFRLPEGSQYIVGFGHQKNTVVIVGLNGSFYRCKFDPETGGEMTQLEYRNFLEPGEASSQRRISSSFWVQGGNSW